MGGDDGSKPPPSASQSINLICTLFPLAIMARTSGRPSSLDPLSQSLEWQLWRGPALSKVGAAWHGDEVLRWPGRASPSCFSVVFPTQMVDGKPIFHTVPNTMQHGYLRGGLFFIFLGRDGVCCVCLSACMHVQNLARSCNGQKLAQ